MNANRIRKPEWIVTTASFSDATGGLSVQGTNLNATDERDRKFSWNIGVHSLEKDSWRRFGWANTVWTDEKARKTFERLAGVAVEVAAAETVVDYLDWEGSGPL